MNDQRPLSAAPYQYHFSGKNVTRSHLLSRYIQEPWYTFWRRFTMKIMSESYPDRIRRIAHELAKFRDKYEVDQTIAKLRVIANELELSLKKPPMKKS